MQMPNRQVPMTSFEDTRVDICLYFIAPHALLPADVMTIKRLGSMVPIVPVISKVISPLPILHTAQAPSLLAHTLFGSLTLLWTSM